MTLQTAIDIVNFLLLKNQNENVKKALKTLDDINHKENKYRWHDLQKDPDDLPNEDLFFRSLLCVNDTGEYLTECDLHWDEECKWFEAESYGVCLVNVIAWREFEEFEGGE